MKKIFFAGTLAFSLVHQPSFSQENDVFVDDLGIMRWGQDSAEVFGFGVNYTVPFAHAYRSAMKLGVSPEQAIDNDVYHFARLGFDAYRVHVWDTEISDTVGNLLENEQLRLFDYMLAKMKDRGMNFILTPIAFWGNGWPEPAESTPGFSHKYGKDECLTDEAAILAQANYLNQFLNHVNPYTGLAYKEDPSVVAFEISNEPHHRGTPESVTAYIRRMVDSMRETGCKKPIFYNISHSIHLLNAYYEAGIQGGTFQWYPTGLGAGEELIGNFLPNVDRYLIPFADNPAFQRGAKIVYEFDAADVGRSYIYPAMARSFRTAGIQWATHFSYDPTYMAYANTEYNTHYMNLAYTPQKALSLKLAGEVFHEVPLNKSYGRYPSNRRFENFWVDYETDLAEMVSETKFIYTNHTQSKPVMAGQLTEIAGSGNSPVIRYEGTGAYFLDKIAEGAWRLEVMPDAIWIDNPFGRNSLNRTLAVINWREWPMSIELPQLGTGFSITPLNEGNSWRPHVSGNTFDIRPGTYLITKSDTKYKLKPDAEWKNIRLNEFYAPEATLDRTHVLHKPLDQVNAGQAYTVSATIVSADRPVSVELVAYSGYRPIRHLMQKTSGYEYTAEIPATDVSEGFLRYFIVVTDSQGKQSYPSGAPGAPGDWDFNFSEAYVVDVVPLGYPVYLFNARTDEDELSRPWAPGSALVPEAEPGKAELHVNVDQLFKEDPENPKADAVYNYSMRYCFKEKIRGRRDALEQKTELVFRGRSLGTGSVVQVALVDREGRAFGGLLELRPESADYRLPLSKLKEVDLVTLPRPYPTFLPYFFEGGSDGLFDLSMVETVQISIGPGLDAAEQKQKQAIALESIWLE